MYYWIYFNPRSREGSDFGKIMKYLSEVDFNPRSREGSDRSSRALIYILHNFNPRSREGSDKIIDKPLPIHPISIHAPARGATKTGCTVCGKQIFQSTLPRGERPTNTLVHSQNRSFQSTLPRGERRRKPGGGIRTHYFNPRSREGSDGIDSTDSKGSAISIHAPARGATAFTNLHNGQQEFQSTLPRGERPYPRNVYIRHPDFNPRSREGSDCIY